MNKVTITAVVTLTIAAFIALSGANVGNVSIENVGLSIEDDQMSPVEVLPVTITGADFLKEKRYTYNDLVSQIEILGRLPSDENQLKAKKTQALADKVFAELSLLPARIVATTSDETATSTGE